MINKVNLNQNIYKYKYCDDMGVGNCELLKVTDRALKHKMM